MKSRSTQAPSTPTISDVAKLARVSTATVSRVLNSPEVVREPLRARVLIAVKKLNYVPNAGARALTMGRSGTIGVIVPTVDNAIFAKAVDALQRRLAELGVQLLLAKSDYDPEAEARQALNLLQRGVDGLVLCGHGQRPDLLGTLRNRLVPVVHVMNFPAPEGMLSVGFDNRKAMSKVVRYLLDLGHRKIAMLAGTTRHNDRASARVDGVRAALQDAGCDLPPEWLVERPYSIGEARDGMRELLRTNPAPTAVICGNDVLAFGALLEANSRDILVPKQVSIVGFDDLELSKHVQPALTTIRVPAELMWRQAADRLISAIRGEPFPMETEVDVSLIVRESTAPPPA